MRAALRRQKMKNPPDGGWLKRAISSNIRPLNSISIHEALKKASNPFQPHPMSTLQTFRRHRKPLGGALAALMAVWQIGQPLQGADLYWDADGSDAGNLINGTNLGGVGTWDASTTANWWNPLTPTPDVIWPNTSSDRAIFTRAYSGLPVSAAVTVDAGGVTANQLRFNRAGFTLSGGSITLAGAAPSLYTELGETAVLSNTIAGTEGLTKLGGGAIRLTGTGASYTGVTTIANGSLIIADPVALGGAGNVSILTQNVVPSNATVSGFNGGALILDGTTSSFNFARNIDFEGAGVGGRGAAIVSVGDVTLSGVLTSAVSPLSPTTFRASRINSVGGTMTLSGTVNVNGTTLAAGSNAGTSTTVLSFGGTNSAGVGNFDLTGTLTGSSTLEKTGAGTLFLNPTNASGFQGNIRVGGSVGSNLQSSVRVTQATAGTGSVFGASTKTEDASSIDLSGGILEFRNNSNMDFNAFAGGKNVHMRASSGSDH